MSLGPSHSRTHSASESATHVVKKGDTLWEIAQAQLGDPNRWQEIAQLNGIKKNDVTHLRLGQELKLPGAVAHTVVSHTHDHSRTASSNVPFISQFDHRVPGHGKKACLAACKEMVRAAGFTPPEMSTLDGIRVAERQNRRGCVTVVNKTNLREALTEIDKALQEKRKRPVIMGVTHRDGSSCADGITDHFVVIYDKGIDKNGVYYLAHDPSTQDPAQGRGKVFRVAKNGNLYHEGAIAEGKVAARRLELSTLLV